MARNSGFTTDEAILMQKEYARQEQCPNRQWGHCRIVTDDLGWDYPTPIDVCDKCFSIGGDGTNRYVFLGRYVSSIVKSCLLKMSRCELPDYVMEQLFERHVSIEQCES